MMAMPTRALLFHGARERDTDPAQGQAPLLMEGAILPPTVYCPHVPYQQAPFCLLHTTCLSGNTPRATTVRVFSVRVRHPAWTNDRGRARAAVRTLAEASGEARAARVTPPGKFNDFHDVNEYESFSETSPMSMRPAQPVRTPGGAASLTVEPTRASLYDVTNTLYTGRCRRGADQA